jgi:hypothetical protein
MPFFRPLFVGSVKTMVLCNAEELRSHEPFDIIHVVPNFVEIERLHHATEGLRLQVAHNPCLGPAKDEEGKREAMGLETTDEVKDSDLNAFLIFGILLLYARLTIRVDAFINPVDNHKSFGYSGEAVEGLERFDNEFDELTFKRHFDDVGFGFNHSIHASAPSMSTVVVVQWKEYSEH